LLTGVPVRLSAHRPEFLRLNGDSLGTQLRRRRLEFGLCQVQAAKLLGFDPKSFMWWERDARIPIVSAYPAIIAFLGREPWPQPQTLGQALLAERRRRGLEIRKAAALVGVDEGTWRRWERGEWKPKQGSLPALDHLFVTAVAELFPTDIR
jgi:transcriptional regulator with XRE-family HTH domain